MEHLLQALNEPQRGAVTTSQGPVMIIAGAGSGKTRVITYRTAHLIQSVGVNPRNILALTFTNRAAAEMRLRVEELLGDGATRGLWIGTFHSNFARLLRQHATDIGYTNDFSIYDAEDSQKVIKETMKELGINAEQLTPNNVQSRISMAKNKFILPDQYARTASDYAEEKTAQIYRRYAERLRRNNALDFDDLLIKPIELLQSHDSIREFYQRRFEYLMIDEYQDTNHAQYIVAKLLAEKHRNVCVVGDDAQSIYSWRGAEIGNILNFQQDYPDAKIFRLEENYRSTKVILKASNAVIKKNKEQLDKTLYTQNETGELVTLLDAQDERKEADKIAQAIRNMKLTKGHANKDFAIFYRTNAQSRAIEDALKFNGIAYQIFGGVSFYKRREIKDVVAYLRFILNEQDEESLLRILNEPPRGLGDTSVAKLRLLASAEEAPLYDIIRRAPQFDLQGRVVSALTDFRMLIESLQDEAKEGSAYDVVDKLLQETRMLEILKTENTTESNARYDNLQEFRSLAKSFCDRNAEANSLKIFLQEVALSSDTQNQETDGNTVSLMTIHAAKGLEFPVVFVTGLEEKLFPLNPDEPKALEEERRLFYVAMTRARKKLFLLYARNRYRFGQLQPAMRSRFIDDLDASVVETEGGKALTEVLALERERKRYQYDEYSQAEPEYGSEFTENWRKPAEKPKAVKSSVKLSTAEPALAVGMRVQHKIFGTGKVMALEGTGEDAKVRVFFKSGEKKLVIKYANLTVLN